MLRTGALCILVVFLISCTPIEGPKLGSGPPVIGLKGAGNLGKAEISEYATFALQPITNAPGEMIYAFEDTLKAKAPERQIQIVSSDDATADYHLKAYLTAIGDYSGGSVLYVLDVSKLDGTIIRRISGEIKAGGSLSDPWSTIADTGAAIAAAREAMDALGNWVYETRLSRRPV